MNDAVPGLFDRLADRYDQVIPFFAEFAGQLLDVLDPDPGTRLLDIGSGRGAGGFVIHLVDSGAVRPEARMTFPRSGRTAVRGALARPNCYQDAPAA